MTDTEWERIADLFGEGQWSGGPGRPRSVNRRRIVDAIFYVAATGCQWRALPACYYDPTTTQYLTPDPLLAVTGDRYGYAGNDPVNGSDPTGLLCTTVKIAGFGTFACPDGTPNLIQDWGADHPGAARDIVNAASGALRVNPITAATDGLGWTDTSQCADTSSGWFKVGLASMLAIDYAAAPSIGQGGDVVTHWGDESPWVMNGGKSWWNYFKSGMPGRAAYSTGEELPAAGLKLSWPSGPEWWKGLLGQRIVK